MTLNSTGSEAQPRWETDDLVATLFRAHSIALIRVALLLVGDQASAEGRGAGRFPGAPPRAARAA
jgi:hypothetical protein